MPRGSTDPDDDNMWREGMENSCCAVIQGLSPNEDIPEPTVNSLPRGHMYRFMHWKFAKQNFITDLQEDSGLKAYT
ncbi:hypothetical protein Tco_1374679 [Tanacetum coccineum]